jgi:hypothetical protein
MVKDIQKVQAEIEGDFIALQPEVEKTAIALAATKPEILKKYLTDYSVGHAGAVVARWRSLGEYLITKYNDGYVQDEKGDPLEAGYPEEWLRDVTTLRQGRFKLPTWGDAKAQQDLLD